MLKEIFIKGELSGRGIVNFDSNEQRFTLSTHGIRTGLEKNVKLGKKSFQKTGRIKEDGTEIFDYKTKISSDCMRHSIFEHDVDVVNSAILQNPLISMMYMLSPVAVMRGYMFTGRGGGNGDVAYKRKSPLTITDAIQTDNAKSEIEVGSTTGDRSDTSLHYSEKVGDIKYDFMGQIDIKQLQFISCDPFFDRMSLNSDWIDSGDFEIAMENHYGGMCGSKFGTFTSMGKFFGKSYGEDGILLSDEICEYLIKKTLKDILSVNIVRNNAFAKTSGLKVKLVDNIIGEGQSPFDEEGWIDLKTEADVDALDLGELHHFFEESSDEEIEERDRIREEYKVILAESKEKKAAEKEEKKQRKNNK